MQPKEWTARFGPLDGRCCVNCLYFFIAIDALPSCQVEQCADKFAEFDVADLKEMLHHEHLMESGDQVYAEMMPVPDAFASADVPALLQNVEALNDFLERINEEPVDDFADDFMPEEMQHSLFMRVGRVVKKLILEESLTRDEYHNHECEVRAYELALPRQRNEQADHFGSKKYFVQRFFEHVACSYHTDRKQKQPHVELLWRDICNFLP